MATEMLKGLSLDEPLETSSQPLAVENERETAAATDPVAILQRKSLPSATAALRFIRQLNTLSLSMIAQQHFGQRYGHITKFNVKIPLSNGGGSSSSTGMGHSMTALYEEGLFRSMVDFLGNVQEIYDPQDTGRKEEGHTPLMRYPYLSNERSIAKEFHAECEEFWSGPRDVARILLNGEEALYLKRVPDAPHTNPIVSEARRFLHGVVARALLDPRVNLHDEYSALVARHLKGSTHPSYGRNFELVFGRQGLFVPPPSSSSPSSSAPEGAGGGDIHVTLVDVCIARSLLGFATSKDTFKARWDPYGRSPMVRKFLYSLFSDDLRTLLEGGGKGSLTDRRKDTAKHFPLLAWTATRFEPQPEEEGKTVFHPVATKDFLARAEESLDRLSSSNGHGGRGIAPCVSTAAEDLARRIRETTGRKGAETDQDADVRLETAQDLMDMIARYNRGYDAPPVIPTDCLPVPPDHLPFARKTLVIALAAAAGGPDNPFYPPASSMGTLSDQDAGRFDRLRLHGRLATPQTLALYAQFAQFLGSPPPSPTSTPAASMTPTASATAPTTPYPIIHSSMTPPKLEEALEKFILQGRIGEEERGTVCTQLLLPTHEDTQENAATQPMSYRFPDTRRICVFAGQSPVDLQTVRYTGCDDDISPCRDAVQLQAGLLDFFVTEAHRIAAQEQISKASDLLQGGPDGWDTEFKEISEDLACQHHPVVDSFSMLQMTGARKVMAKDALDLLFLV